MNATWGNLIWILFLVWGLLLPVMARRRLDLVRAQTIYRLQRKRKSRVISLIHRQEAVSFLGIPLARYIDIEDSEQVLRAIRLTPQDVPIDLILHTPGGLVLASEQIARALSRHRAKVTVMVPHYAMSGGTMLALAADEILLDPNAVLGPVDPQVGQYPAVSILAAVSQKDKNQVDDKTLILADIARKAISQTRETVTEILLDKMDRPKAEELAEILTDGRWTHDYPITCETLQKMGLPACTELPEEVYQLMELYPQPAQRRPSVQYVPWPTGEPADRRRTDTR
ncbi:MAG TPA: hypothetical protein GX513_12740 [Firmicutes bacterium]|nr:hypothetical protein [Bacillota bacterium]